MTSTVWNVRKIQSFLKKGFNIIGMFWNDMLYVNMQYSAYIFVNNALCSPANSV